MLEKIAQLGSEKRRLRAFLSFVMNPIKTVFVVLSN